MYTLLNESFRLILLILASEYFSLPYVLVISQNDFFRRVSGRGADENRVIYIMNLCKWIEEMAQRR